MTTGSIPRQMPVPKPLPGGLTLDQMHALYGRLDILRDDLSGLLEDGYLPHLRVALDIELAHLYLALGLAEPERDECRPGHHRPGCGFAATSGAWIPSYEEIAAEGDQAELAELDGLRADALEHEQAAVYEEIAEAEERAAWGDR